MPLIKSAIKKLRKDKKRTAQNKAVKKKLKALVKKALAEPVLENVKLGISMLDRAAKKGVIHKNKAARLKSRLMKNTIVKKVIKEKKSTPKKAVIAKKKKVTKIEKGKKRST